MRAQPRDEPESLPTTHRALRAHDIHQGLHQVERNIGLVGAELKTTQFVGMAAALATAIKGQDVVEDAIALETVAAEQLDIDRWAFEPIIRILEEVEFIRAVQRQGSAVTSFYESVPPSFEKLYQVLGQVWTDRRPGEIEQALVATVQDLSFGPRRVDELAIDPDVREAVLALGREAEAIQVLTIGGEDVAHSPFFAFEHPESMADVLADLDVDAVRTAFEEVRSYQGTPIDLSQNAEVLGGLVAAGLIAAPALEDPSGNKRGFAVAAYGLGRPDLLVVRKPVLDKALAIVSAIRMGQHWGGITSLRDPVYFLRLLSDPTWSSRYHSSARRQYGALYRMGIIRFVGNGSMQGIQLIDADDNKEAVELAIEFLAYGEATTTKETRINAREGLEARGSYRFPIQGVASARRRNPLPDRLLDQIFESAMGRTLL